MSLTEKIKDIESELAKTQKNKKTEYHIGLLKGKLARYRAQLLEFQSKGSGGGGTAFEVSKTGDARVALVGLPSVGKSSLHNILTQTNSVIGAYEFTTLTCVPGLLKMNGAKIQILDLPGIIRGASSGRGRGKQVIATARTADLVMMIMDITGNPNQKRILTEELEAIGVRLNRKKPQISLRVKPNGGVQYTSNVPLTNLDDKLIKNLLHEYKIFHAEILFHEDSTIDDLIDTIELMKSPYSRQYCNCLYVYNKCDQACMEEIDQRSREPHSVVVSCESDNGLNMDSLLMKLWEELNLIRLYTKPHTSNSQPDFNEALVVPQNSTLEQVCLTLHKNLPNILRHGIIWGKSVKYSPQRVGLSHVVEDEDVVEIVKKSVQ